MGAMGSMGGHGGSIGGLGAMGAGDMGHQAMEGHGAAGDGGMIVGGDTGGAGAVSAGGESGASVDNFEQAMGGHERDGMAGQQDASSQMFSMGGGEQQVDASQQMGAGAMQEGQYGGQSAFDNAMHQEPSSQGQGFGREDIPSTGGEMENDDDEGDVEEQPATEKESHSSKRSKQEKPEEKSKDAKRSKRQAGNYFNPMNYRQFESPALSPLSNIPSHRHHKTVVNVDVIGKRSVQEESPVNSDENHFLF